MCQLAGTLTRDFKHLAVDLFLHEEDGKKFVKVERHFGKRKNLAANRTVISHIQVGSCIYLPRLCNVAHVDCKKWNRMKTFFII